MARPRQGAPAAGIAVQEERRMAIYTVKLVDRRSSGSHAVCQQFKSTSNVFSDSPSLTRMTPVNVSWGAGAESDNLVMHFVEDSSSSYLKMTWPNLHIDANAGGHTHSHHSTSGTELYRIVRADRFICGSTASSLSMKRCTISSRGAMTFTQLWATAWRRRTSRTRTQTKRTRAGCAAGSPAATPNFCRQIFL